MTLSFKEIAFFNATFYNNLDFRIFFDDALSVLNRKNNTWTQKMLY